MLFLQLRNTIGDLVDDCGSDWPPVGAGCDAVRVSSSACSAAITAAVLAGREIHLPLTHSVISGKFTPSVRNLVPSSYSTPSRVHVHAIDVVGVVDSGADPLLNNNVKPPTTNGARTVAMKIPRCLSGSFIIRYHHSVGAWSIDNFAIEFVDEQCGDFWDCRIVEHVDVECVAECCADCDWAFWS